MSNVVTMSGDTYLTWKDMLENLLQRSDIEHITCVIQRKDDMCEIQHDKQQVIELSMSSTQLRLYTDRLAFVSIDLGED